MPELERPQEVLKDFLGEEARRAEAVVIVLGRWKGLLELERGVSLLETWEVGWEEPLKEAIAETWQAILVEIDYPVYSAQVDYPAD